MINQLNQESINGEDSLYTLENLDYFQKNGLVQIDNLETQKQTNIDRTLVLEKSLIQLGEVKKLLIKLKNSKMFDKKDFILTTINTALRDVFIDQEVKIDLKASNTNQEASKLNIKYDIVFYQNGVEMASNEKLLIKIGGGIMAFISILFKILVGYIYSKNKFYIFDESLSEVSELYMPRMGQFIQKFCERHGFTIILITHTPIIAEYADLVYKLDGEFQDGVPTLKIDKIEGNYPEENYIYTKIENFQSIKKLEFRYKGFTAIIGKNSIGKSASFRAVNSILFNNFDIKEFPRFLSADKPDKLLNTKLEFGKFHTKDDPRNNETKIGLYKKGQSIIWEFNGMEFVGKNLAFDKVKEKIESIGFKYLKLKDQYKNFKGNLKEQTERLAVTTQQDGYYLIGGKATDTAKIFDFLFDTREVTMALQDLNNDILKMEQELNTLNLENGKITNLIFRTQLEIKHWDILFKITLISELRRSFELVNFCRDEIKLYIDELKTIDKVLDVSDWLWRYENIKNQLSTLEERNGILHHQSDIIVQLVNNSENITVINNVIQLSNSYNSHSILLSLKRNESNIIVIKYISYLNTTYLDIKQNFENLRLKSIILDKIIVNSTSRKILEELSYFYDSIHVTKNRLTELLNKSTILEKLGVNYKSTIDITNIIYDYNILYERYSKINLAITYNKKCLVIYDKYIEKTKLESLVFDINTHIKLIETKKTQQKYIIEQLDTLPNKYGLVPCPSCSTLGFTCVGH